MGSRETVDNPEEIVEEPADAEVGGMPAEAWVRAIIELLEQGPITVDEVASQLGERFPTADAVPVDDYVSYLVTERIATAVDDPQHFSLTEGGRTILSGILASPGR